MNCGSTIFLYCNDLQIERWGGSQMCSNSLIIDSIVPLLRLYTLTDSQWPFKSSVLFTSRQGNVCLYFQGGFSSWSQWVNGPQHINFWVACFCGTEDLVVANATSTEQLRSTLCNLPSLAVTVRLKSDPDFVCSFIFQYFAGLWSSCSRTALGRGAICVAPTGMPGCHSLRLITAFTLDPELWCLCNFCCE